MAHSNSNHQHPADDEAEVRLLVENATCASCVNKIESALSAVTGVKAASMNLVQQTVTVIGNVPSDSLIQAIKSIGYQATEINGKSDDEILSDKELADQTYYKHYYCVCFIKSIHDFYNS